MVLEGKNTIGGTKILLCENDHGLLLDFGMNYTRYGQFFEEYMKPRSVVGLYDLWATGLVPHYVQLYRPDTILTPFVDNQTLPVSHIDGVVLSHAHMDHAGLIGTLNLDIPIIASRTTLAILRANQDSGKTSFYQEAAYTTPFQDSTCREHTIKKQGQGQKCPDQGRNAIVLENEFPEGLSELWKRTANPDGSGRKMISGSIATLVDSDLPWTIESFPVDHSIPGACATIVKSEHYTIAYTGDIRFSGTAAAKTRDFIRKAKEIGIDILIIEGTQLTRQNECCTTEQDCKTKCNEIIENAHEKLVIADFSPKNIERLIAFAKIAEDTRRRLVILPKDAYLLYCLNITGDNVPMPSETLRIYNEPKGTEAKWEQWIYGAYKNFLVKASEIASSQGDYILAFSLLDMNALIDIKPTGGLYVYSSSEPFSEEQNIDFKRLRNWLTFYDFDVKGVSFELQDDNVMIKIEPGYHCSGHATDEELEQMIEEINPNIIVPIHTTNPQWFREKFGSTYDVRLDG